MNQEVYDKVYEAMEGLYDACIYSQEISGASIFGTRVADDDDKDVVGYLKEWLTVRVGTTRRSGKTMSIQRMIREKSLRAVVFTVTQQQAKTYKRIYHDMDTPCMSARSLVGIKKLEGQEFDAVFIDEAAFVGKKGISNVVEFCLPQVRRHLNTGSPFVLMMTSTEDLILKGEKS